MTISVQSLLVGASLAYAVSHLRSTEPIRKTMGLTWGPLGKLASCPFCLGFWTSIAAHAAFLKPETTLVWAALGWAAWTVLFLIRGIPKAGVAILVPGIACSALLGTLCAAPALLLTRGYHPTLIVSWGLLGSLWAMGVSSGLMALGAISARFSLDDDV